MYCSQHRDTRFHRRKDTIAGKPQPKKSPQLVQLVDDSKDVEELMSLPPEKILLRWMNFHLEKAGYEKIVTNFSSDIKDGEAYAKCSFPRAQQSIYIGSQRFTAKG